jgi:hypothetical protein
MSDTLRNAGIKDIGSLKSADVGELARILASLPVQVGKRTVKLGDVSKDAPRIAAQDLVNLAKDSRTIRLSTTVSATSLNDLINP